MLILYYCNQSVDHVRHLSPEQNLEFTRSVIEMLDEVPDIVDKAIFAVRIYISPDLAVIRLAGHLQCEEQQYDHRNCQRSCTQVANLL